MRCTPFNLGNGVSGFICGSRARLPKCSTPGCPGKGELECDAAVERKSPAQPKRGDAGLHREHKVVFFVWSLSNVEGVDHVTISTAAPGHHGALQTVPVAEWFRKTTATCDKPVCRRCATSVDGLDFCGPHARAAANPSRSA